MLAAQPKLVTAEDLERLSAEGCHYELIRGVLHETPPAGYDHGRHGMRLITKVGAFIVDNDLGEIFRAETGFFVEEGLDTVLAPDWAFVCRDRLPEREIKGFARLVPDIVFETRSPNDSNREIESKIPRWLDVGVRRVWDFDPSKRTLRIYRSDAEPETLTVSDTLEEPELLPGLSLPLKLVLHTR